MTQSIGEFYMTDDSYVIRDAFFENTLKIDTDKKYAIWKNDEPLVLIEVARGWNPFDDAYIFRNKVYIGNNDKLIILDLITLDYKMLECEMYFGYFYEYGDYLFVATGTNLMCFGKNGEITWKTQKIAIDGVTFGENICDGRSLEVSCCMDSYPAQWCKKVISVTSGEVLSVGEIEVMEAD